MIRAHALEHQKAKTFKFIQAALLPPKKVDVLHYLGIIPAATPLVGPLLRRADVDVSASGYSACAQPNLPLAQFIDPLNG